MKNSKNRMIVTGSSAAINHIVKSIIDRSGIGECQIIAPSDVGDCSEYSCVVICEHIVTGVYTVPSEFRNLPAVMVTSSADILSSPEKYGLYAAIENSGGGTKGFEHFSKELISVLSHIPQKNMGGFTESKTISQKSAGFGFRENKSSAAQNEITSINYGRADVRQTAKASVSDVPSMSGIKFIAIGASTGGTDAIIDVVRDLPANTPPVVIVQHMPEGFTKMYADRLNRICKMSCKEAEDGDRLETGRIIVAHGARQMQVHKDMRGYYISSKPGEKVSGHCPSVDVLFRSAAACAGKDAIGVILTGMGRDGATGLGEMRRAGAYTIGQDEQSCVVYGMPREAFLEGAVKKQAPLSEICGILTAMIK